MVAKLAALESRRAAFPAERPSPEVQAAVEQAAGAAMERIKGQDKHAGRQVNGWTFSTQTGC